jgi:hypothetical protein
LRVDLRAATAGEWGTKPRKPSNRSAAKPLRAGRDQSGPEEGKRRPPSAEVSTSISCRAWPPCPSFLCLA